MAQKTRSALTTQANIIRNETTANANTATRVGTIHVDEIDSNFNLLTDTITTIDGLKRDGSNANSDIDIGIYSLNAKHVKINGMGGAGHVSMKHQSAGITANPNESSFSADNSGNAVWKNDGNALQEFQMTDQKTAVVVGNETNNVLYLSVKGYYDYLVGFVWLTAARFGTWLNGLTAKTTVVGADQLVISDSAASNNAKKITLTNFLASIFASPTFTGTVTLPTSTPSAALEAASKGYVDAQTGSVLAETAQDGTVSSGATNTYSQGLLITPAMISVYTSIEIVAIGRFTGGAGNKTIRLYANTTNNLSGSPILLSTTTTTSAGALSMLVSRFLRIKVKTGTGAGTEVMNSTLNFAIEASLSVTSAVTTAAIDWTNNVYIVAAVQCGSGSDSANITALKVRR